MKKSFILFFMMAFVWSSISFAQNMSQEEKIANDNSAGEYQTGQSIELPDGADKAILLSEDFATQLPADWTQVIYSGTGTWQWDGGIAAADSDANITDVYDVGFFTPALDFTDEIMGAITLWHNFQDYNGFGECAINVYSGGMTPANLETQLYYSDVDMPYGLFTGITESFGFDPSTFADPSQVYLEFWYSTQGGTWAWFYYIDDVVIESVQPRVEVTPTVLDLGEWPIGGWQEMQYLTVENTGAGAASLNASELDDPDGVFGLMNPTIPFPLPADGTQAMVGVGFDGEGVAEGDYAATYVASWGAGKSVTTADIMAYGYDAPVGDIVENPFMVAALPYSDAGVSTAFPMRSNYNIPGSADNGKDVVYMFSLAEDKELDVVISNATETPKMAIYAAGFDGEGGPMMTNAVAAAGDMAMDVPLFAGDYYLVVSAEGDDVAMTFDINIDATTMPDPECIINDAITSGTYFASPSDGAVEVPSNGIVLSWEYGQYVQEYQLLFGTTYPPTDVIMDWTAIDPMGDSYALPNLDPSMQYFWQVNVRNNNETVECDIYGFTTTLTPPSGLTANVIEIAEDEYNVELNWVASAKALLSYNVYRDGALIGTTNAGVNTYTDLDLPYNMNPCYEYQVEAVFDEGISELSLPATACITGVGTIAGNVSALLTGNPISGATLDIVGTRTYQATTDLAGNYSIEVLEDTYTVTASADGYISEERMGVVVDYNTTTTEDFLLDEFPFPVNSVVAVPTEDDEAVDVYWNSPGVSGGGGIINEEFTGGMPSWFIGDAPEADWYVANNMLTLTTGGADVWRSGYRDEVYTDALFQVSQQRNGGSTGGSMGIYVRGNGFADMNIGSGSSANMFCWTTNGYWWYGTLTDGDLPDWSGWATTGVINQGLGQENIIGAEIIGSNVTFTINGTVITSVAAAAAEGYLGGFAHEGTVASEMAFDYWQIIPGGMSKNAIVLDEKQFEGKGSFEECLSAPMQSANVEVKGLDYDTRPAFGDKDLGGYMVYRAICGETTPLQFLGMTLDTNFRDNTWNVADWGMYWWAVEAVYTNNNSAPEFSNCLDKDMWTTVGVEVTTNSGDAPEGCYVAFTNTSEPDADPPYFYEVDLDATGMYNWETFRKGMYDIYVSLPGFAEIMLEDVFIPTDTVFVWQLEELLAPPTDLYVTPTGFATWTGGGALPFEPLFEDFEGGALPDGWTMTTNSSVGWFFTTNGSSSFWTIPAGDGTYACSNDDAANDDGSMDYLITPMQDFSNNAEPFLTFSSYYSGSFSQEAYVEVSVDGSSWEVVHTLSANSSWTEVEVDLADYAGESEVWVAFHADDAGFWASGWAVDNVAITEGAGKYNAKAFQFFKVWHDGVFSVDTDTNFYQYGDMGEVLVPGETYLAEVAALYSTGLSDKAEYEWTYLPCDSFPNPNTMDAYNLGNDDNVVVWSDAIPMELIEINQGYGDPSNGYFQSYGFGYGVAYDFSMYPDALVNAVNFRHSSWGVTGTWDYMIHIINRDDNTTIAAVGPFQTTGNDTWEMMVELGDVATGGATEVAILMEPMGNDPADAYPCLDSDDAADPQGSIYGDLADLAGLGASGIGNFLMDVYIYTANGGKIAAPVVMNNIEGPAATARVANNNTFNPTQVVMQQEVANKNAKAITTIGTNVYRDGEMIAFVPEPDTFYLDMNLEPGYYDYCIATVYSEDDGEHWWTGCEGDLCVEDVLVDEECLAPENLQVFDEPGNGTIAELVWDAPNGFDPVWLQYDDGTNVDAIGGPTEFTYAVKWDPDQLVGFDGTALTKVKFFPREAGSSFTLKVWKGANAGTLVHEQPLSGLTFDAWNEIDLSTAVDIDPSEELWVGFYTVTAGYPAGCGNAVGEPNSDLISLDGVAWEHLSDYSLPYSWNLGAYVEAAKGEIVELPALVDHATYNSADADLAVGNLAPAANPVDPFGSDRALMGYNVYRDGDQINEELVLETMYTDELPHETATYCYEVTAVYSVCGESDPSNEVCHEFFVGVNNLVNNIAVYPNPAKDFVMVESSIDIRSIEVTNYMGQVVNAVKAVEMTQYRINTSALSAGVYFVEVETAAGIEKVRIIISE